MKTILHITCSPRGQASESSRLSGNIVERLRHNERDAVVVSRSLGDGDLFPIDEDYATSQQAIADVSTKGSMALSNRLIDELERADYLVIGTPMHNFTVPFVLKAWIDHVVRVRRSFDVGPNGKIGRLSDRPVFIAIASGGRFSGDFARQPDFLTPYLTAILGMIGLKTVTFFSVQGTVFGEDALAEARAKADKALQQHFQRYEPVA